MVNSKKMSKSSVAIIVLSILLVLSMVLGLTGAWFTSSDKGTGNGTINFGKVEVKDATATVTVVESKNYVPGDTFSGEVSFVNGSNVAIWYCYDVTATVKNGETVLGEDYVTISGVKTNEVKQLAANALAPEADTITFSLVNDSEDNTLNGVTGVSIEITITVYAVQADNMDAQFAAATPTADEIREIVTAPQA